MNAVTLIFSDDAEMASFVRWYESADCDKPRSIEVAALAITEDLLSRGWTRHGYLDDTWCPPGKIYDDHYGILEPDDARAIAGNFVCRCGFETDRLAHIQGHMRMAREGARLSSPGPHKIVDEEIFGPEHREFGQTR